MLIKDMIARGMTEQKALEVIEDIEYFHGDATEIYKDCF